MKCTASLFSSLVMSLLLAGSAFGQNTAAPTAPWELKKDGTTLDIKQACTTAQLDAACKAGGAGVTTIKFDFNNKAIDSLTPLGQLKGLKSLQSFGLDASRNKPFDATPLAGLTELEDLNLYATRIKNAAALASLKKLKKLSFYMSDVDSITCVKGMPDLEELSLYGFGHTFPDYTPLLTLQKLKKLDIYMNKQATDKLLAPLSAMTSLESISMSNDNDISTLSFLKGCKGMRSIEAHWCKNLKDISACQQMNKLETLSLAETPIPDITPLAGCVSLRSLEWLPKVYLFMAQVC